MQNHGEDKKTAIPGNFPRDCWTDSPSGELPKLHLRRVDGRYLAGLSEAERRKRFDVCSELLEELIPYAQKEQAEQSDWATIAILQKIGRSIEAKKGVQSRAEIEWIVGTLAERLGWPMPPQHAEAEKRTVKTRVVAVLTEFKQVRVESMDGLQYAITDKTPGIDWRSLQVGQFVDCTATTSMLPCVLKARLLT